MSFWTFDNVYEELGPQRSFMNTGYGMLGQRGIPRPSYNTFCLLHRAGREADPNRGRPYSGDGAAGRLLSHPALEPDSAAGWSSFRKR